MYIYMCHICNPQTRTRAQYLRSGPAHTDEWVLCCGVKTGGVDVGDGSSLHPQTTPPTIPHRAADQRHHAALPQHLHPDGI